MAVPGMECLLLLSRCLRYVCMYVCMCFLCLHCTGSCFKGQILSFGDIRVSDVCVCVCVEGALDNTDALP